MRANQRNTDVTQSAIDLNWIGNNRFEFTFVGEAGRLTGRVSVTRKGDAPDHRSTEEKGAAARQLVDSLVEEFSAASREGRYAKLP